MTTSVWQRLGLLLRSSAPGMLTLFLVFLSVMPMHLPNYGAVAPMMALMAVYYWAVHRPDLMPYTVLFALGVMQDVVMGAPIGINAFLFLSCHVLVASQRRFLVGRSFWVLWWGFLIVGLLTAVVEWGLFSAIQARVMPVEPAVFRALMTMAAFPALAWVCIQVHRLVPP